MSESIINVLYVDDEKNNLNSFKANFRHYFNIYYARSSPEAEVILDQNEIHVLVTDQKMPIKLGTELLADCVKKYPELSKILLTAFIDTIEVKEAMKLGYVFRSMEKPWNDEVLKDIIKLGYESYIWKVSRKNMLNDLNKNSEE